MTCTHPACDAGTPNGIHLCPPHVDALARLVERAPSQIATARETVAKLGSNTSGARGDGAVSAAPINLDALARVDEYVALLRSQPLLTTTRGTPTQRAQAAALRSWSGPHLHNLTEAEAAMMRACDRPTDWLILGPCAWEHDGVECGGQYRYQPGQVLAECPRCTSTMDVTEYRRWQLRHAHGTAGHTRDTPAPLARIVEQLSKLGFPISHAAAQKWAQRGKLTPTTYDGEHPRYTPNTVLAAFDQTPAGRRFDAA